MDDWGLQGLGRAVPWKQPLFSQGGSAQQELETKKRGQKNECLRDRVKFGLCVPRAEGAAGRTPWSRSFFSKRPIKQVACTWQGPKGKERGREAAVGGGEWDKEGAGGCPYMLFSVRRTVMWEEAEGEKEEGKKRKKSKQYVWRVRR